MTRDVPSPRHAHQCRRGRRRCRQSLTGSTDRGSPTAALSRGSRDFRTLHRDARFALGPATGIASGEALEVVAREPTRPKWFRSECGWHVHTRPCEVASSRGATVTAWRCRWVRSWVGLTGSSSSQSPRISTGMPALYDDRRRTTSTVGQKDLARLAPELVAITTH